MGEMYNPNDFVPKGGLESRYAKKMVNDKFYGTVSIKNINPPPSSDSKEMTLDEKVVALKKVVDSLVEVDFKELASLQFRRLINIMTEKIMRDHCET